MIELNDVLSASSDQKACFEGITRVVGVSEDGENVALIRLDIQPIKAPFIRPMSSVNPDEASNGISRLETFNCNLAASKDELSSSNQTKLTNIVTFMETMLGDTELILDSERRGREIDRIAQTHKIHKRTVRRHFYEYLWGGMTELAFAGPQKPANAPKGKQNPGTGKRGKKPREPENTGSQPLPEHRENLEKGVRLFYLPGKYTKLEAYVQTLTKFYAKGKEVIRNTGKRLQLKDIVLPLTRCPTVGQFDYIAKLLSEEEGERSGQPRKITPGRKRKAQRGKARDGVAGPGFRFEIDATKIQIRIVSRYDADKLINEATLYIIIDVWSGAIVGYSLSLEPASWFMAAKALRNCFTPKTDVFERLKLPYGPEAWVAQHLPTRLAADRGELVSDKAGVVPELGLKVEIMASMRPDRKGSVEGKFEAIKHGDNFYLKPGKHLKRIERRGKDGKKEAALDLETLEAMLVEIILDLNNDPVPAEYLPAQAVKAGIDAVTYGGLYEWGLKNRSGFTRKLSKKVVTNELMLKELASVTPAGIQFKKYNYTSHALISSGLLERAALNGHFKIEIRYDEMFGDRIFYLDNETHDWVDVLNDNTEIRRLRASFWEMEWLRNEAEKLVLTAKKNNIANKEAKSKGINARNKAAIKTSKAAKKPGSRSASKQAIRENTQVEIAAEKMRRQNEELHSIAAAVSSLQNQQPEQQVVVDQTQKNSDSASVPQQSVGQRSRELWEKMKNANLGK